MPMTDAGLSAAIKTQIIAQYGSPTTDAELQKFCDAVGKAVVDYIKANALVTTTTTGVTTGPGTAPGTGTIS